jgi:hypothetical protein
VVRNRKSKKIIGPSGRTRTYNPSVNSNQKKKPSREAWSINVINGVERSKEERSEPLRHTIRRSFVNAHAAMYDTLALNRSWKPGRGQNGLESENLLN